MRRACGATRRSNNPLTGVPQIPVHWYGNFEGFASHVGQVNATYPNMTMWVTEYALPDSPLEASQEFYNQSAAFMDRTP